jgi:hypothetical protein
MFTRITKLYLLLEISKEQEDFARMVDHNANSTEAPPRTDSLGGVKSIQSMLPPFFSDFDNYWSPFPGGEGAITL